MAKNPPARQGGDLFIVDNSHKDWKVLRYLREWCDIATGMFEARFKQKAADTMQGALVLNKMSVGMSVWEVQITIPEEAA